MNWPWSRTRWTAARISARSGACGVVVSKSGTGIARKPSPGPGAHPGQRSRLAPPGISGRAAKSVRMDASDAPCLPDRAFWTGRRVLVTGHTGFKGAWLSLWLVELGATVVGFSRGVPTEPSLHALARVGELVEHREGDVRDEAAGRRAVEAAPPDVVLPPAAQPMVRRSFAEPVATYATNVMGTA